MSERYSISGQILTDMADAIRNHKGLVSTTFTGTYLGHSSQAKSQAFSLPTSLLKDKTYKMTFTATYARNSADSYYRVTPTFRENTADGAVIYKDLVKQDSETVIIFTTAAEVSAIHVSVSSANFVTLGAVKIEPCDKDGNILYYFTPAQMVEVMENSLPSADDLVLTGDWSNGFNGGKNKWILNKYLNLITTKDLTKCGNMFFSVSGIDEFPFEFNMLPGQYNGSTPSMFSLSKIKVPPKFNDFAPTDISSMFGSCEYIREFPEGYFDNWDWKWVDGATNTYSGSMSSFVNACSSLRKYPMEILEHGNPNITTATYTVLSSMIQRCYALDELTNIPKPANSDKAVTANLFHYFADNTYRLKNLTFASGITLNWSNQTIDLSKNVGYVNGTAAAMFYNSGITEYKGVYDDETYQALKNDPDWFSRDIGYSRYDHDSAVRTINSLPTMTGTGNTIKFKGDAGAKTDAGAINTLTEAEIARAAAKGWTVTLV